MVNNQSDASTFIGVIDVYGDAPIIDHVEKSVSDVGVEIHVTLADGQIKITRLPSEG
jgi:hypothetical protein